MELDFDACGIHKSGEASNASSLCAIPQKVRKAPEGQVSPPEKSGISPRQVRQNPPTGQANQRKRLIQCLIYALNLNL